MYGICLTTLKLYIRPLPLQQGSYCTSNGEEHAASVDEDLPCSPCLCGRGGIKVSCVAALRLVIFSGRGVRGRGHGGLLRRGRSGLVSCLHGRLLAVDLDLVLSGRGAAVIWAVVVATGDKRTLAR